MMMTQEVAFQCLESWGNAVAKKDKSLVLGHYADNASLWPTLSNELRQSEDRIGDYFDLFLPKIAGMLNGTNVLIKQLAKHIAYGLAFIHLI